MASEPRRPASGDGGLDAERRQRLGVEEHVRPEREVGAEDGVVPAQERLDPFGDHVRVGQGVRHRPPLGLDASGAQSRRQSRRAARPSRHRGIRPARARGAPSGWRARCDPRGRRSPARSRPRTVRRPGTGRTGLWRTSWRRREGEFGRARRRRQTWGCSIERGVEGGAESGGAVAERSGHEIDTAARDRPGALAYALGEAGKDEVRAAHHAAAEHHAIGAVGVDHVDDADGEVVEVGVERRAVGASWRRGRRRRRAGAGRQRPAPDGRRGRGRRAPAPSSTVRGSRAARTGTRGRGGRCSCALPGCRPARRRRRRAGRGPPERCRSRSPA